MDESLQSKYLQGLRKHIESTGRKQKVIAAEAGLDESVVSRVLRNGRKVQLETFLKIARAAGYPFRSDEESKS